MARFQGFGCMLCAALFGVLLGVALPAVARAADDATCTSCHDAEDDPELLAIGRTRHGVHADSRTPGCTSCHGQSQAHVARSGAHPTEIIFKRGSHAASAASVINASCLSCHASDVARHLWTGSAHERHEVACTACHTLHVAHDPVQDKRRQPEVCYACHKAQRAQFHKPSRHPTSEGKVACSDCHSAHGGVGRGLLKRDSVVETCYTCHTDKRGPFLNDHQPVADDCVNCHAPHGSSAAGLLKARAPQLCYQCHTGHSLQGGRNSPKQVLVVQARSCLNCHTEIHGSNSPHGGQNLRTPN